MVRCRAGARHSTCSPGHTAPTPAASHCGQRSHAPAYGTRVRLRAGFRLDDYTGDARVIPAVMRRYGLILADQGSAWYVTRTTHPDWEGAPHQLRELRVRGGAFEVLASGAVTVC